MSLINLSPSQLRQAADLKEKIAGLEKELASIIFVGGKTQAPTKASKPAKKGGMSAAGKAKIAEAQKLRWAKVKAAKGKTVAEKVIQVVKAVVAAKPAKLGGKSAAAKASQSAKMKAYWAAKKAAKINSQPATKVVPAGKPAKKKFVMSAAAKAKISAAAKARWAKVRAAKK